MSKIKFAIVGCGRISYKHVQALIDNTAEAELVAVCDVVQERAAEKALQYEKAVAGAQVKVYTDYHAMLVSEAIDVVAIASESGYHFEHALDCMKAGKHILVEKPMALSSEHAQIMNAFADEKQLKLGVCHQNRFNMPIQNLRSAVEDGRFGKLINGTARILWTRDMNYYQQAPWRGTKAMDGGTLMNQCIHNIDLLQWMMGGEPEMVFAQTGTFVRDIEMEDFGSIMIRFKNGSIGIVEGSACVYPKNLEETLSIFGSTGTVVIGGLAVNKMQTWNFADQKAIDAQVFAGDSEIDNVYGSGHTPLYTDFIDAVRMDRMPLISGHEGQKAMNIILAAYQSQKEKRPVMLEGFSFSTEEF